MTASNASPAIFMSPQMRPELHAGIDPELFDAHYWYRQELMHFGRKLDLSTAGGSSRSTTGSATFYAPANVWGQTATNPAPNWTGAQRIWMCTR